MSFLALNLNCVVVIKRESPVIIVQKKILSEDDCDILNRKLQYIRPEMIIIIVYYDKGQYIQLEGKVSKINLETKIIQIVKTKINLKAIVDINGKELLEDCL